MVKQEIEVRQTILTSKIGYNKYRRRADDFNNFSSISILEQLTSTNEPEKFELFENIWHFLIFLYRVSSYLLLEGMTLLSRTQALDAKQTANSLIIFFKEGLARTKSIRKSKRTEKALLLGCDESKLQQDWERSSSFSLDWNVYM